MDLYGPALASDGTYVYLFGGQREVDLDPQHYVRRYDPATDAWTTLFPLPEDIRSATAVYGGNGRIYVFNGLGFYANTRARTYIYNIAGDT